MAIPYRRFGTIYDPIFKSQVVCLILEDGTIDNPETSVATNLHCVTALEGQISHLPVGRGLKSGKYNISIFQYISKKMQRYTVYLYLETSLHVSGVPPLIIRSAYNCIYSIWYFSDRYCYLPLSWKSWNERGRYQ